MEKLEAFFGERILFLFCLISMGTLDVFSGESLYTEHAGKKEITLIFKMNNLADISDWYNIWIWKEDNYTFNLERELTFKQNATITCDIDDSVVAIAVDAIDAFNNIIFDNKRYLVEQLRQEKIIIEIPKLKMSELDDYDAMQ